MGCFCRILVVRKPQRVARGGYKHVGWPPSRPSGIEPHLPLEGGGPVREIYRDDRLGAIKMVAVNNQEW